MIEFEVELNQPFVIQSYKNKPWWFTNRGAQERATLLNLVKPGLDQCYCLWLGRQRDVKHLISGNKGQMHKHTVQLYFVQFISNTLFTLSVYTNPRTWYEYVQWMVTH